MDGDKGLNEGGRVERRVNSRAERILHCTPLVDGGSASWGE